jgi:hypothetical protein
MGLLGEESSGYLKLVRSVEGEEHCVDLDKPPNHVKNKAFPGNDSGVEEKLTGLRGK